MTMFLLVILAAVVLFGFGTLFGCSLETRARLQRSKRLARVQEEINAKVQALQSYGQLSNVEANRYLDYEYGGR